MKVALFYHSLLSDWNHGNAHFLRGVASELVSRGAEVRVYEPRDAWSLQNLLLEHGEAALDEFYQTYPQLESHRYDLSTLDLDKELDDAEIVLVHEWNDPALVKRVGVHRFENSHYRLLFHDTHHRAVTAPESMAAYDLRHYDGVLAFGEILREMYLEKGWTQRAWTWHEAADTRVFHPVKNERLEGDLVWIGNWGDEERTAELHAFLLRACERVGLNRPRLRRALSRRGAGGTRRRRNELRRLAAQHLRAANVRPLPRHRPRAAWAVHAGAARHSHHSPV